MILKLVTWVYLENTRNLLSISTDHIALSHRPDMEHLGWVGILSQSNGIDLHCRCKIPFYSHLTTLLRSRISVGSLFWRSCSLLNMMIFLLDTTMYSFFHPCLNVNSLDFWPFFLYLNAHVDYLCMEGDCMMYLPSNVLLQRCLKPSFQGSFWVPDVNISSC